MAIEQLNIGTKTANQGVNASGKLTATEFNQLVAKVNEMIVFCNKKAYVTQSEYDTLVANGQIIDDVEYNIYDE